MKKTILGIFTLAAILTSCADTGKEAVVEEAGKVVKVETKKMEKFISVDPSSTINWRAAHLGGVQPRHGKIKIDKASVTVNDGKISNALFVMNIASLTVENFPEGSDKTAKLTGHLQNEDFFYMEKFPTVKFELVSIEDTEGKFNSKVTGNLTIKDVTKSITFNALTEVSDAKIALYSEDFKVDRSNWGLTYNQEGTEGVPTDYLIANDIGFTISLKMTK